MPINMKISGANTMNETMNETKNCLTTCPFTDKPCTECGVYRGRHRHIVLHSNSKKQNDHISDYFKAVNEYLDPWAGKGQGCEKPDIAFRVLNMENRKSRICEFEEAKSWDWGDPTIMRLIDGWHVKSYNNLVDILCYKEEKGHKEAELQECPRFMLLSGG
ncbi:MAG: hypothetical protein H6Q52_308 [Deltaproteobacteria bacterium]|nr:hypothetical protein [Deltaproteobacteria bacterium]